MKPRSALSVWLLCGAMLGTPVAVWGGAPPAAHHASSAARVRAQIKAVDAKLAAARARQASLQAQVAALEQKNDAQQKLVQQRDATIATLQRQLAAAGAPASAPEAGHPPGDP